MALRVAIDARCAAGRPSGVGQYALRLLDGLCRVDVDAWEGRLAGLDLRVIATAGQHGLGRRLRGRARVTRVPPGVHRVLNVLARLGWRRPLAVDDLVGPVDVAHAPGFVPLPQRRGATVVTVHDLGFAVRPDLHDWKRVRDFGRAVGRAVERADLVIADSETTRDDILRVYGPPRGKVRVVPLAHGPEYRPRAEAEVAPALAALGLGPRGYILHVGTLEPRKNVAGLVEAYARLGEGLRARHPLVLAGAGGAGAAEARRRAGACGLRRGDVRFLGYVDDATLPALVAGAAVLAYPSFHEGFGLPPLEAMACGTPVVASTAGAVLEVVGTGDEAAALTHAPEDAGALAGALERVLTDVTSAGDLRRRGLARAGHFSWLETARRTAELYREAAGRR